MTRDAINTNIFLQLLIIMKTTNKKQISTQFRFVLTLHATWSVLRDPVLTKMYTRQWKRYVAKCSKVLTPGEKLLSLYGYVWNVMYHEV